jgi:hypothetical protein
MKTSNIANSMLNIELTKNYNIIVVPKDIYAHCIYLTIVLYVSKKSEGSDLNKFYIWVKETLILLSFDFIAI